MAQEYAESQAQAGTAGQGKWSDPARAAKPQTFSNVLATVTGSWYKDRQTVETIGEVVVRPGKNTLKLTRKDGAIPHIQEFRLVSKEPFFDFDPDAD